MLKLVGILLHNVCVMRWSLQKARMIICIYCLGFMLHLLLLILILSVMDLLSVQHYIWLGFLKYRRCINLWQFCLRLLPFFAWLFWLFGLLCSKKLCFPKLNLKNGSFGVSLDPCHLYESSFVFIFIMAIF